MKTLKQTFLLLGILLYSCTVFAQQRGINYKALIKDANGNVLSNTSIRLQFSIIEDPSDQYITYSEEHQLTTDANGMVIANIGTGTQISEDDPFSELAWESIDYYLNVKVDVSGGTNYVNMGTTQFMTVPYAKYADTATTVLNAVSNINGLSDGKSDSNGSSLFLGVDSGASDDGIGPFGDIGNKNVGVGYQTLYNNTEGYRNVAIGYQALYSNTEGANNVANGYYSLYSNTTGDNNTANGIGSLNGNTTGDNNTANGSSALRDNTIGNNNTANGISSLLLNTTGNNNTANGAKSLLLNTIGNNNTANGYEALLSNTNGSNNTANGYQALYNNTKIVNSGGSYYGDSNTANGAQALYNNTDGYENTAIGALALYNNTTGLFNTASGNDALFKNITGNFNTANGHGALFNNINGNGNVGLGYNAGYNETGSNKLYIANSGTTTPLIYGEFGTQKLEINGATTVTSPNDGNADLVLGGRANTTAGDDGILSSDPSYAGSDIWLRSNDAVVVQLDFDQNEAGDFEIRNGNQATIFNVNESGDVKIGGGSPNFTLDISHGTGAPSSNTGNGLNIKNALGLNRWTIYNSLDGNLSLYQNGAIKGTFSGTSGVYSPSSDKRLKRNIKALTSQLDKIMQLKPSSYQYKSQPNNIQHFGLIAQEVKTIYPDLVPIIESVNDGAKENLYGVSYTSFVPVLISGIQEQQQKIKSLEERVSSQNETISLLISRIEALEKK